MGYKEKLFHREDSQPEGQVAQTDYAVSVVCSGMKH